MSKILYPKIKRLTVQKLLRKKERKNKIPKRMRNKTSPKVKKTKNNVKIKITLSLLT